jgi:hypothetical protein
MDVMGQGGGKILALFLAVPHPGDLAMWSD